MNAATRIYLQAIDAGLAWMSEVNQRQQMALVQRARVRREEDKRFERRRALDAEQHDMKIMEGRRVARQQQELKDRRAELDALRAWREAPNDRRDR